MLAQLCNRLFFYDIEAYFVFLEELSPSKCRDNPFSSEESPITIRLIDPQQEVDEILSALSVLMAEEQGEEDSPENYRHIIERRFACGDDCVIAEKDNRIVGMAWVASAKSDILTGFASFSKHYPATRVVYNDYVSPPFRGQRLQLRMDRCRKQHLQEQQIKQSLIFVGVKNFASIKNCMRTNDRYKLIYHVKIELPLFSPMNIFLKRGKEAWLPCK